MILAPSGPVASESRTIRVLDENGAPLIARVLVKAPEIEILSGERRARASKRSVYFYARGASELRPLEQATSIQVSKGFDYPMVEATLAAGAGETIVTLKRAFDARQRGYYSGDGHVHPMYRGTRVEPSNVQILNAMKGEDLNIVNALAANALSARVYWGNRVTGRDEPESEANYILRVSEEYRSKIYGHLSVFGARRPSSWLFTAFEGTRFPNDYPLNYAAAKRYALEGAFTSFAHLRRDPKMALEAPADIALGAVSAIELMGYAVLTPEARLIWEALLSTGFDVVITAGTDVVMGNDRELAIGGARVYVPLGSSPLTYDGFVSALAAGRGFVTSGPLLFLRVADAYPGDVIELAPGEVRALDVEVEVLSVFPWSHLRLRHNGRDALHFTSSPDAGPSQVFRGKIEVAGSGWLYAYVDGPKPRQSLAPRQLGRNLAITNAVWLKVPGQPRRDVESAREFVRWIEGDLALLDERNNYGSPQKRQAVHHTLRRAIQVFKERARPEGGVPRR